MTARHDAIRDPGLPAASRRDFVFTVGAAAAGAFAPRVVTHTVPRAREPAPGDFLFEPGLTYLQTGSLGPTPRPVMEKFMGYWHELERNPTQYGYGKQELAMEDVRTNAAAFIGCTKDELILTGCTTDGMNIIAGGLSLGPGDHVLTTDQEHPGGRNAWEWLAATRGTVLENVPIAPDADDPRPIIDAFAQRISARTKVVMFSHILTSTGYRMPVREIADLAHARGALVVVDGAQAVGGIAVDVKALGCDAYVSSGHKWMCGPKGTGLLYLSAAIADRVRPVQLHAGRAAYSASNGVRSLASVLALADSIDYLLAIGTAHIEAHDLRLAARVHEGLQRITTLRVMSPPPGPRASALVSYELPATIPANELRIRLHAKHGVFLKVVPANFFNGNRVSTHLFNTDADVDRLLAALRAELK